MSFQVEDCIFFQLAKTSQIGTRYWAGCVSEYGITPAQAMVLNFLGHQDRITARELAQRTLLDGATLTGILDRLESAGYLKRMPHPDDRRAHLILLRRQGKDLAQKIYSRMIEANQQFLASLDDMERRTLKNLLGRLRKNMQAAPLRDKNTGFCGGKS